MAFITQTIVRPLIMTGDIDSGFGTGQRQIVHDLSYDYRVDSLLAVNADTIDHVVHIHYTPDSGTDFEMGSVLVPAGAGFDPVPPVEMLAALSPTLLGFTLNSRDALYAAVEVALNFGKVLTVTAYGGTL